MEVHKNLRRLINKLSVHNIAIVYTETKAFQQHENFAQAYRKCLFETISVEIKLQDFQLICLSGLTAIIFQNNKTEVREFFKVSPTTTNLTNQYRFLAFLYIIGFFGYDDIADILTIFIRSGKAAVDPLINFLQLAAVKMREEHPSEFVEFVQNISKLLTFDNSSRSRFLEELFNEIMSNSKRLLKKYINSELDCMLKQIQQLTERNMACSQNFSSNKCIEGINSEVRIQIFSVLSKSTSVMDAVSRLLAFSNAKSFDFDFWFVCSACVSREPVYNTFYFKLCIEIALRKYKVRKSLYLFAKKLSKDLQTFNFKQIYLLGRFLGDIITHSNILPLEKIAHFSHKSVRNETFMVALLTTSEWGISAPHITPSQERSQTGNEQLSMLITFCKAIDCKIANGHYSSIPYCSRFHDNLGFLNKLL